MSDRFADRVAIVTGGGGGVGRASARRLAADGASVLVADIDGGAAEDVVEEIAAAGGVASAIAVDVAVEAAVAAMVAAAVARYGRLDILHNNAADTRGGSDRDVVDLDLAVWERRMAVNAGGVMLGCKHAIPVMRAGGGGVIVNMASVSGLVGSEVNAAYGSSKAAVIGLTRYVATMHGRAGIRCVAVAPGLTLTERTGAMSERALAEYAAERLLPWTIDADNMAGVVAWLASDEASGITGQTIVVDCGTTAHRPRISMRAWEASLVEDPDLGGLGGGGG